MSKNLGKWIISTMGIVSIAFSLVLLFSSVAKASCNVSVTCPAGSAQQSVECGGDYCFGYTTSVSCSTGTCNITRNCKDKVVPQQPNCN